MEIIAFLLGILAVYYSVYGMLLVFFIQCIFCYKRSFMWCFLLGSLLAIGHDYVNRSSGFPEVPILAHALLTGHVKDVSSKKGGVQQYTFLASSLNDKPARAQLMLRCYRHCPSVLPGQFMRVDAKIKKPRNLGNPAAFDYVRWALARHIDWVGYVRPKSIQLDTNVSIPSQWSSFRTKMAEKIDDLPLKASVKSIVMALSLGLGDQISKENWELFRHTGTAHLMVISGAHIGLVAGLMYWIAGILWRCIPNACLWIPAQRMGSLIAIGSALSYALLSGFAVPAQRALIGCLLYFARFLYAPFFANWQIWRYAMLAVLVYEPHAVLMSGFYLSFTAVAILLFANQWVQSRGLKKHLIMQMYCLFGLLPLSLYCFGYGAINGFFANLLAIPWVGFIVVPISLISGLLALIPAHLPIAIVSFPVEILLYFLHALDRFSWLNPELVMNHPLIPLAVLLFMGGNIVFPRRWFLWPVFCVLLASSTPPHPTPAFGDARMDVLDVGQGLSILIETQNHRLIYDTGVKFYQGPDMGNIAILPYLRSLGIRGLDYIVISHPDLDHRGGLESLEAGLHSGGLIVDDPGYYKRGINCHQIPPFVWDGVRFAFLPLQVPLKPRNNHSCVLRVYNAKGQFLLTGDIERDSEEWLVEHYPDALSSRVLVAPHHGSKTSSSQKFLEAVHPDTVIISSGFDNRFHFPHPQAMQRYAQQHAKVFNTADDGLVSVFLNP